MFLACDSHRVLDLPQGMLGLVLEAALVGSHEQKESNHNLFIKWSDFLMN